MKAQESISFWIGYIEQANIEIDSLTRPRGEIFKKRLHDLTSRRAEAFLKISELARKADALKGIIDHE